MSLVTFIMTTLFARFYIHNGTKDINKWYILENGTAKYKGQWKNGKPNGKGIYVAFKDVTTKKIKSTIEGNFVDGDINGYALHIFEKEDEPMIPHYKGMFKNNLHHGTGEYHWGTGSYYKGEFRDGKFHGKAIHYTKNRDETFIGEYFEDERLEGICVKGEKKFGLNSYGEVP